MSGPDGRADAEPLSAVMVCTDAGCASCGTRMLEALRPLVARTPRAVLVKTGCLHPGDSCGAPGECSGVRLQRCTGDLRPLGPSLAADGTPSATFRTVEAWLDHLRW